MPDKDDNLPTPQSPSALITGLFVGCAAAGLGLGTYWVLAPFLIVLVIAIAWLSTRNGSPQFVSGAFAALAGFVVFGVLSIALGAL